MLHYTDIGLTPILERKVCQYCGKPLHTITSQQQGCGDICKYKHRKARYRVVGEEAELRGQSVRFEEGSSRTDNNK